MSSISQDQNGLQGSSSIQDSWVERFASKLYSKEHLEYHTEIISPDAMTFLDSTANYMEKAICPEVGTFIRTNNERYRINMVAFQRKRAGETERIAKGKVDEEKEAKKAREVMLGMGR